ncbi:arginine--tRNA ligase [Limibacillus sp. MBR-115]|jgi:arginyl-tRNA synthetase|uniref:arginine--tRNA ligase n=1 Tax=Limibacillus sp. MBR-115 TaxID=3156465 RepID=UPI003393673D
MNIFNYFSQKINVVIGEMQAAGEVPPNLDLQRVSAEAPRDTNHGDVATNAALVLSKAAGMNPRAFAEKLSARLALLPDVSASEVAGPGFINLRLSNLFWQERLREIIQAGTDYGSCELGGGRKVNVEYVSANPTGPLTVGHARGAVVGDALAAILEKAGYDVCREYYINDAGTQVDTLAQSAYLRYREALGEDIGEIPPGFYPGDYLKDVGQALAEAEGDSLVTLPEVEWFPRVRSFAIDALMTEVRNNLAALGIHQDEFSSERALVAAGGVEEVASFLKARGLIYEGVLEPPKGMKPDDWEPRPQTLFRSTDFGDDVDRPLKKSDGTWTYFAGDMAYHLDKFRRGYKLQIDVWGADHGGYIKRMQSAVKALTEGEGTLHIVLCQLVKLLRGGDPVKMSKRAGTFITLQDVIDEVGKDALRFIMLTRKSDQHLEFDLEKVMEQSRENPVFYVQYAHARCRSVLRHAASEMPEIPQDTVGMLAAPYNLLTDPEELALIKVMAGWPKVVEGAAEAYEPHRVAFYLYDLAAAFHQLWNKGRDDAQLRFLLDDQPELTRARLALVQALATVIASGLAVMGVEPVEEM